MILEKDPNDAKMEAQYREFRNHVKQIENEQLLQQEEFKRKYDKIYNCEKTQDSLDTDSELLFNEHNFDMSDSILPINSFSDLHSQPIIYDMSNNPIWDDKENLR